MVVEAIRTALVSRRISWPALTEAQRFMLLSILIGVFAGLLVVCFHMTIEFLHWIGPGGLGGRPWLARLFWPAAGAALAAMLVSYAFPKARGSGVNQTKAAVYIYDGYVPFSSVIGKFLACSLSIGSGNSLGPEDPSLQMGAGVASLLGRAFKLTRDTMRMIAPVGAAAGIAAAFNAPITAVLFVMEQVVAGWHAGVLGSIVLSATSAVVVSRWFLGSEPLFSAPEFQLRDPFELSVHALIGVAGGLLAVVFMRSIVSLRHWLRQLPAWTRAWMQPAAAGLLVGLVGWKLPEVMGAGYEAVDSALHNRYAWTTLLALGLGKLLVTSLCFSAGTPGGMFAPTLFAGAMMGGALGSLARELQWFPTSPTSAYVLVGMGTFFAGVFRAPMTSIFMVFEVSASYVIILPVMIANTIAYAIARSLQRIPFFEMHAREENLDLPSVEEQRELRRLRVEDAMSPPQPAFGAKTLITTALQLMRVDNQLARLVKLGSGQWTWVCRDEVEEAVAGGRGQEPLESILRHPIAPRLYPDMSLDFALRAMAHHPILPVAHRANVDRLVGTLTLEDIHNAYGIDLRRRPCDSARRPRSSSSEQQPSTPGS